MYRLIDVVNVLTDECEIDLRNKDSISEIKRRRETF
jgi:hypothetical protein